MEAAYCMVFNWMEAKDGFSELDSGVSILEVGFSGIVLKLDWLIYELTCGVSECKSMVLTD